MNLFLAASQSSDDGSATCADGSATCADGAVRGASLMQTHGHRDQKMKRLVHETVEDVDYGSMSWDELLANIRAKANKDCSTTTAQTSYPFDWGTITVEPLVQESDTTAYTYELTDNGRGREEYFWDYRCFCWADVPDAIRLKAIFKFGDKVESLLVRANNKDFADHQAVKDVIVPYLESLGRMPHLMWSNLEKLTVNGAGDNGHAGANAWVKDITMNIDFTTDMRRGEVFLHEGVHVSLQQVLNAGMYDGTIDRDCNEFFSSYAAQYPATEGMAESFLPYFAIKFRRDRLTNEQIKQIVETGPNRMLFFEEHVNEEDAAPPGYVKPTPAPTASPTTAAPITPAPTTPPAVSNCKEWCATSVLTVWDTKCKWSACSGCSDCGAAVAESECSYGYDVEHKGYWANHRDRTSDTSAAACAERCNNDGSCVAFSRYRDSDCYLYSEPVGAEVNDNNGLACVKVPPTEAPTEALTETPTEAPTEAPTTSDTLQLAAQELRATAGILRAEASRLDAEVAAWKTA